MGLRAWPSSATSTATWRPSRPPWRTSSGAPPRPAVRHRRPGAQRPAPGRGRPARDGRWSRPAPASSRATPTSRSRTATTRAAFPWLDEVPAAQRAAAEWAHDAAQPDDSWTGSAACPPSDACGSATTSSSSATARPAARPPAWRPSSTRRSPCSASRAPTRGSSCCGHTHVAEMRELGRKLIVQPGLVRLRLRRRPRRRLGAGRRSSPTGAITAELRRASYDAAARGRGGQPPAACPATCTGPPRSARGGSSDERRHAAGRAVVVTGLGAVTPLGQRRGGHSGRRLVAGESGVRPITSFDPGAPDQPHRRRGARLRPLGRPRPQGDPAQRPVHPVRPGGHPGGDGPGRPAGPPRGRLGRADRRPHRLGPGRHRHARRADRHLGDARTRPRQPVLHPHGHRQHGRRPGLHRLRRRRGRPTRPRSAPVPAAGTPSARRPRSSCAAMPR